MRLLWNLLHVRNTNLQKQLLNDMSLISNHSDCHASVHCQLQTLQVLSVSRYCYHGITNGLCTAKPSMVPLLSGTALNIQNEAAPYQKHGKPSVPLLLLLNGSTSFIQQQQRRVSLAKAW